LVTPNLMKIASAGLLGKQCDFVFLPTYFFSITCTRQTSYTNWLKRSKIARTCSSHKDASIRSSQLHCGRTVHLEFSSSTDTQQPSYIHVPSWS